MDFKPISLQDVKRVYGAIADLSMVGPPMACRPDGTPYDESLWVLVILPNHRIKLHLDGRLEIEPNAKL